MKTGWLQRFKEPSTWASIGGLGLAFKINEIAAFSFPEIAAGLALLAGILIPEGKKPTEPPAQ